jgi:subtilisin family serine protease
MHWCGVRVVFVALLLLSQASDCIAGFGSLRQRWPQGHRLEICFFGGSPEAREDIARIAREWTRGIGISFEFGRPPAFNSCSSDKPFDVRLGFEQTGSWSSVGTDARKVDRSRPTINFEGLGEGRVPRSERKIILEEFGHVLGILHGEQDPRTNCFGELDLEYFRTRELANAKFKGSIEDEIKRRYFPPEFGAEIKPNTGEFISTGIDTWSVMRLFDRPEQFKGGATNRCLGSPTDELSAGDRALVALMYPPKPAEISADAAPTQMTIRFEGLLASEHFGYVLDALYERGKIAIKKHVSYVKETIQQVVAEERLAPRGVTADSFERFLCRINLHICVWKNERAVWTNAKADRNYVDRAEACGDLGFPRFVVCIPNIRFAAYDTIANVLYDGQQGSLKQLVVEKHRGCPSWDELCRAIVQGLNPDLQRSFTKDERLLPPSFRGEIDIPSRAYRLVIEYRDEQDREELEAAVKSVVERRAKQLKIGSEQIAIRITYPIGSPKAQAGATLAAAGQAALDLMSYPQLLPNDLTTMALLVEAGLWDTVVDITHCQLDGVIRRTPADLPPGTVPVLPPPQDKPTNCGDSRVPPYELSKRYDHATAVAGILSGKGTNNGVKGILPGMKLWAWEVLNGNQFNASNKHPRIYMAEQGAKPSAINISQLYNVNLEGKATDLEALLFGVPPNKRGMHNTVLFVAAAGVTDLPGQPTVGAKIDQIGNQCNAYPACWSNTDAKRALISVVALNGQGDDLLRYPDGRPATNYGLAFDVTAVGNVRAPFFGGWTGDFPGSSAAAPFVTGLAAMIAAKQKQNEFVFMPIEVKQRILFTADNKPELGLRDFSRYGRINFAAALNFEDDVLRWQPSALCPDDPCIRKGRISRNKGVKIKVDPGATMDGDTSLDQAKTIDFKNLKRLASEGSNQFTVIFVENGALHRIAGATISIVYATDNPTPILRIGNADYRFETAGLLDYTSCSWFDYCQ